MQRQFNPCVRISILSRPADFSLSKVRPPLPNLPSPSVFYVHVRLNSHPYSPHVSLTLCPLRISPTPIIVLLSLSPPPSPVFFFFYLFPTTVSHLYLRPTFIQVLLFSVSNTKKVNQSRSKTGILRNLFHYYLSAEATRPRVYNTFFFFFSSNANLFRRVQSDT